MFEQRTGKSFNHPMVKVKAVKVMFACGEIPSFNHPMVKVKETKRNNTNSFFRFQPPYGES